MIDAHEKLDFRIQQWIFKQGWGQLREIQCLAIEPILSGSTDVLISASTAAGKTEAFFLPAISSITDDVRGVGILYISPLKALINDQDRRLESLSDLLNIQITPWHGDSPQGRKNKLKRNPSGIVLITPESLESLLIRDSGWVKSAFQNLKHIVVDEFHAFIGTERGHHLLSLLHRLEHLLGRVNTPIPRTALSATLGDLESVPASLRPNKSLPCKIIKQTQSSSSLKMQVKGYIESAVVTEETVTAEQSVCNDLYGLCRGGNHLVFANSRSRTESIATTLAEMCESNNVPNEFFPHHGSLAKEMRETLEARLQQDQIPTTAVCTMTLELGIDIGKVNSVVQVTAPHSIASLRQRMGRSGRRGGASILRMLITEAALTEQSSIADKLRLELVQSLAMIRLLVASKWYEPADTSLYHFSTLLHQVLAFIAQWGGVRADQIYVILCKDGPFQQVTVTHFKSLLSHMGKVELITQLGSGELVLGHIGEKVTNHYTFYAVFKTPEEFRIVTGSKTLGTLPVDSLILEGQHIIFAGKRWVVELVDADKKVISVKHAKGGKPPKFGGSGMDVHDVVRQEMHKILKKGDYRIQVGEQKIEFGNVVAQSLFREAVDFFQSANLKSTHFIQHGNTVVILPWAGDKVVNTLVAVLINKGFGAGAFAGVIEVEKAFVDDVIEALKSFQNNETASAIDLAEAIAEEAIDKFDEYLPQDLLTQGYAAKAFDVEKARVLVKELL
ncbi:DEAD/DEAH box helicase [Pseudoalteromonas sp. SR41-8]|uniref:DEAD/DEAH box helicase n=1 Tax=Pseudoalteromonas sp. SR41-8 TaxID=2760946 RepID=UPI001603908A|nr:DEAD/DEAH box helicase [Pseudoalteromonas sp. SR41-8]MBB1310288.1 DEAD/DEAH box helicase [Pseudoalteromonas sp. SR41-8]